MDSGECGSKRYLSNGLCDNLCNMDRQNPCSVYMEK